MKTEEFITEEMWDKLNDYQKESVSLLLTEDDIKLPDNYEQIIKYSESEKYVNEEEARMGTSWLLFGIFVQKIIENSKDYTWGQVIQDIDNTDINDQYTYRKYPHLGIFDYMVLEEGI